MSFCMAQGTLWDLVASMVPADAQPAAPGRLSQHDTLAKTLLLLPLVSQGVPLLTQVQQQHSASCNLCTI